MHQTSADRVPELNLSVPKDRLGENLISKEEYEELQKRFRKENGEEM